MIVEELIALLGFEMKGEGDLRKFRQGLDDTAKKAEIAARRIDAMSVAIGSFVGTLAANLVQNAIRTIASLPGDMTRAAADFETLMTGIQKKAGATAEQMEAIGQEVLDLAMGGDLASSIDEIAAAYERGAAAGLPLDDLREFALLSTKAADAFEMSAEATGNAFVGFQKVLGVAGDDLERVADLINYLADSGIADERDIVAFMDSAGALAKTVGFSVEETAALAAALVNLKVPAGEAATAMNAVLTKLIAPQAMSKQARAAFEAVVGDAGAFAKAMAEDADTALVGLLEKLSQLENSQRAGAIAQIFGLHHADVMQQLVTGVDELKRNLTEAKNEAAWLGSLQQTYAMKLDDYWSKSQRFWNNMKGMLTVLGERTLPLFGEALDAMSDFIHRIAFDGSLDAISEGFDSTLRSVRDFGRNMWRATRFVFDAAVGVNELISRVTGLNRVASAGLLGAAAIGMTATGRAGVQWLAARFPAIAGILLLEDLISGLSGDDSYIGGLEGGQEALDKIRSSYGDLTAELEKLTQALSGLKVDLSGFSWMGFISDEILKFVRELNKELENLSANIRWFRENVVDPVKGGFDRLFGPEKDSERAAPVEPELFTGDQNADARRPVHGGFIRDETREGLTYADGAEDRIAELQREEASRVVVQERPAPRVLPERETSAAPKTHRLDRASNRVSQAHADTQIIDPALAERIVQAVERLKMVTGDQAIEQTVSTVANDNRVTNVDVSAPVTINATTNASPQAIGAAAGGAVRNAGRDVGRSLAVTGSPAGGGPR